MSERLASLFPRKSTDGKALESDVSEPQSEPEVTVPEISSKVEQESRKSISDRIVSLLPKRIPSTHEQGEILAPDAMEHQPESPTAKSSEQSEPVKKFSVKVKEFFSRTHVEKVATPEIKDEENHTEGESGSAEISDTTNKPPASKKRFSIKLPAIFHQQEANAITPKEDSTTGGESLGAKIATLFRKPREPASSESQKTAEPVPVSATAGNAEQPKAAIDEEAAVANVGSEVETKNETNNAEIPESSQPVLEVPTTKQAEVSSSIPPVAVTEVHPGETLPPSEASPEIPRAAE
jgi:hypothetical protein